MPTTPHADPPRRSAMDRLMALAGHPAGLPILCLLALVEATLFFAPTEGMLIALVLARRERAWLYGLAATLASVVGGVIGYEVGAVLYEQLGLPLIERLGLGAEMASVTGFYQRNAIVALLSSGYTPIPYMLYTMVAGATGVPLATFIAGSLAGRALKYLPIAALTWYFGPAVRRFLDRWLLAVVAAITAAFLIGLVLR